MSELLSLTPLRSIAQALKYRSIAASDKQDVLSLHDLVFGSKALPEWYDWKYGTTEKPGPGQGLGAWSEGKLVAFCGGIPRTLFQGRQCIEGLQMGDVMVHPQWRGILTRRGPFYNITRQFHESRLGDAPSKPFSLGFGFPNARHLKLGAMLGLMHDRGCVHSLHWQLSKSPGTAQRTPGWPWKWRAIDPHERGFGAAVNRAWKSMQREMKLTSPTSGIVCGERSADYVLWRYAQRPENQTGVRLNTIRYRFFELHRVGWGAANAIAVMDLSGSCSHLVDWIGPASLLPMGIEICKKVSVEAGTYEMMLWASPLVEQAVACTRPDARHVCAGFAVSMFSDKRLTGIAVDQWWLMGGDTDFL